MEQFCWAVLTWDISWDCSQNVSQSCAHLKAWLGLEDSFPRWLTQGVGKFGLALGMRTLFFWMGFSTTRVNILVTWWPASPEWVIQKTKAALYRPALKADFVTSAVTFCHIDQPWFVVGGDHERTQMIREWGSLGSSWRLAITQGQPKIPTGGEINYISGWGERPRLCDHLYSARARP